MELTMDKAKMVSMNSILLDYLFIASISISFFCGILGSITGHPYIAGIGTGLFVTFIVWICIKTKRKIDYAALLIYSCIAVYFCISGEINWIATLTTAALSGLIAAIVSKHVASSGQKNGPRT